jgi:hypothetical protein
MAVESVLIVAFASFVVGLILGRLTASGTGSPNRTVQLRTLPKDLEARVRLLISRSFWIEFKGSKR